MELKDFFAANPRVALAFSGGTDSAYLLYAAKRYGADVRAYCLRSAFQTEAEGRDARRLAEELGAALEPVPYDILSVPGMADNPPDRCYRCKKAMFTEIAGRAAAEGRLLIDGTNASDREDHRPGMRALRELGVRSPLRECGLTKDDIRRLSREAGLFTWDKQSFACLAVRFPTGERLTEEKLREKEATL